jgi:hypothetical protein
VFNQFGDLERCALRPGNVHSADGWEDVLRSVLARYSAKARPSITRRRFRADAAFAIPALFDLLEAEGWDYAIRIKGNPKLHERISWLAKRRPGRPPHHVVRHYTSFHYRAKSWSKARRVVAKVEFHPGELFPRVGFIVTNRSLPNERVLAFYNDRGTAEQHIKEGKHALKWTRLSCMRFAANAVRLQLHALAYNLANFLRTLATPAAIETWSLTSLRERLVKTGARLVRHARYAVFQFAEAALPREVFAGVLDLINGLRGPPQSGVEVGFGFGWRDVAGGLQQAAVVEPVDPVQRCVFDRLEAAPWSAAVDDLGLEEPVDRLGQGVVVAVAGEPLMRHWFKHNGERRPKARCPLRPVARCSGWTGIGCPCRCGGPVPWPFRGGDHAPPAPGHRGRTLHAPRC